MIIKKETESGGCTNGVLADGRLTKKKLIDWINLKFKEFHVANYEVFKIDQTRFRPEDYQAGAAQLFIWFKPVGESPDHLNSSSFMCFYRISELEYYMKKGHELFLEFNNRRGSSLTDLTISPSLKPCR